MREFDLNEAERQTYRRYAGLALPRHTSYPAASAWSADYGPGNFRADLASAAAQARPLSLYVHVPFCERLCYYCACTKEIVPPERRRACDPGEALLAGLEVEASRLAGLTGAAAETRQVHLGGGSPTFLTEAQLERLWGVLAGRFRIAADAEIAVEVDPRVTTFGQLQTLRALGFNRVSIGVQDFDAGVQRAVNRFQPLELVARLVGWCRELGFGSVNFDLIYGLPFQTPRTMAETLDQTLALGPDRIAFYRLAVIPEMFRWQNAFRQVDLPAGDDALDLNLLAINRFLAAGYEFIGLDHFAKPGEALARARREGSLCRNFQGMATGRPFDLLGLGPSAISQLDAAFAQNQKITAQWTQALGRDVATARGLRLTHDDRLRRELLQQLYSYGHIDVRALERPFGIIFDEYFAPELERLRDLADEGLVTVDEEGLTMTAPLGRLLARVVAAVFDRSLPPTAYRTGLPAALASRVG